MSTLPVCNLKGERKGEFEIADDLLVYDKGQQAVHQATSAYMASQRSHSASTLTKGEVRGTGSKPWRQKGTGNARAGYRSSPIWRSGGVAFGPKPHSFAKKLPKQVARLAFRRAFSEKVAAGAVMILEDLEVKEPKTRMFKEILNKLEVPKSTLILVDKLDDNVRLASRNLPQVEVSIARDTNTYQLIKYRNILVTRPAMDQIQERLQRKRKGS